MNIQPLIIEIKANIIENKSILVGFSITVEELRARYYNKLSLIAFELHLLL